VTGDHGAGDRDRAGAHDHDLRYFAAGAQPEVFAATAELSFEGHAGAHGVEAAVRSFLARLSPALAAAGCVLVGHVKGVVTVEGDDELEFSLTRLDGEPRLDGALADGLSAAELTLNVIVFGVDEHALPGIVTGAWPPGDVHAAWRRPGH
jgi:hypothetical protein